MNLKFEQFRTRVFSAAPTQLVLQTFQKWQQDECSEMGAALSYYALFSLFPTFLVILSITGFLLVVHSHMFIPIFSVVGAIALVCLND